MARLSYGPCQVCGGPILYQGAGFCSPDCQGRAALLGYLSQRKPRALDTETALTRRGLLAPPLACLTWKNASERGIVHAKEAKEHFVSILNSDELIVGFNIAYDMTVCCAEWPDLIPLVFEAYQADRITDVMYREKLRDIAEGTLEWGEDDETQERVYLSYNLEEVAYRRCRIKLNKGGWQLRFGELIDVPMSFWPLEAQQYAVMDAVATEAAFLDQEREDIERGTTYFEDQFRQARAYFWLQLMGCWGFHTELSAVREFARKAQLKYEQLRDELVHAGLVTKKTSSKTGITKFTKKKKPVQDLVVAEKLSEGKQVQLTKTAMKRIDELEVALENEYVPAKRASLERQIEKCLSSVVTDKDVCGRAKNPLLKKYADLSHYEHMLTSDVPLLMLGTEYPIQGKFDLASTGRTKSTLHHGLKGNTQNWSTSNGMRECVMPRPGCVFAIGDFAGFELRTWSQVCLWKFGQTRMGEMLNKGLDPHLEMASLILKIPYEQAKLEFEQDPKGRVYLPRQTGKVGDFGLPGGLGADRLVDYARTSYNVILTREEAVDLKDHWLNAWPEAQLYLNEGTRFMDAKERQCVQYISNRVRGWQRPKFTEYLNSFFQGLAADAAKNAGFLIAYACYADTSSVLYGSRPCMFIHDEFVVEVKDDQYASDKAHELARLMELGASPFLPDIPPVVEPVLARRWSKAAKPIKDSGGRLVPWEPKAKAA